MVSRAVLISKLCYSYVIMKTAILVSGGVDSSVALRLLHEQGHTLTAFYLKIWLEDELAYLGSCPWEDDLAVVRAVCAQIGVPLEIVPLQREYAERVVAYTLEQVKQGYTPNPDVMCNQQIKFGAFYDVIGDQYDAVATGHYALRRERAGLSWLYQAPDPIKDQTYFLSLLSQQQVSRALFPLGEYTKAEVRQRAAGYNLPNATRKDSQGICFLGKIPFTDFLRHHLGVRTGYFVEYETGKKLATHDGFWFYTIGQRSGIGLSHGPWYVVKKDIAENVVFISNRYHNIVAGRQSCIMGPAHWIAEPPCEGARVGIKLRHGAGMHQGIIRSYAERPGWYRIELEGVDQGIASGQFAVIYDDRWCLGGGAMIQITADHIAQGEACI